jgi:transcriptional regulator with XRE-family HTH domain
MSSTTTLVPTRRLGTLLRHARVAAGLELADLIDVAGMSITELDDIEHGRRDLDDSMLEGLVRAYGIEEAGLVPERSRLVIDLDAGRIAVNQADLELDVATGPDAILARYLALVYRLRDLPIGSPLQLRDIDLDVLSVALELASTDVESRLHRLMDDETTVARDQRRIRRQLLMPLVGIIVAATAIGTVVLVAEKEPVPGPSTTIEAADLASPRIATAVTETAPPVVTDLGNGAAVEQNPAN